MKTKSNIDREQLMKWMQKEEREMNILCICMIVQQFAFQRTLITVNLANRIAIGHTGRRAHYTKIIDKMWTHCNMVEFLFSKLQLSQSNMTDFNKILKLKTLHPQKQFVQLKFSIVFNMCWSTKLVGRVCVSKWNRPNR